MRFIDNQGEPRKVRSHDRCVYRAYKDETASKLDQLAEKLDRSRSYMAAAAIEAFVEQQEWQLAEIEAGLTEADRGEFASDEDVAKVVRKYVKSARQS